MRQVLNVREAHWAFAAMTALSGCRLDAWLLYRDSPEGRWEVYVAEEAYDAAVQIVAQVTGVSRVIRDWTQASVAKVGRDGRKSKSRSSPKTRGKPKRK